MKLNKILKIIFFLTVLLLISKPILASTNTHQEKIFNNHIFSKSRDLVDLEVTNFVLSSPDEPTPGEEIVVRFNLYNHGNETTENINWMIDTNSEAGIIYNPYNINLGPDEWTVVYQNWTYPEIGSYDPVLTVDYDNSVEEYNEDNNEATTTIVVDADNYQYLECGDVITESVTLAGDILNCLEDGLVVDADNVVIDCNGHIIQGDGDGSYDWGISFFRRQGVTIKNCRVEKFNDGIYVRESNDSIVRNNQVEENFIGITVRMANNNLIENNKITNSEYNGIYVSHNFNIIKNNILSNNDAAHEIRVFNASYGQIKNNLVHNDTEVATNYGLRMSMYSNNNEIKNNTIKGNIYGCLCSIYCENNLFIHNNVTDNTQYGIRLEVNDAVNNTFSNNLFINNNAHALVEGNMINYWSLDGVGNYWDDHECIDNVEPFGICDNAYSAVGLIDEYPLAEPTFLQGESKKDDKKRLSYTQEEENKILLESLKKEINMLNNALVNGKDTSLIKELPLMIKYDLKHLQTKIKVNPKLIQKAEVTINKVNLFLK